MHTLDFMVRPAIERGELIAVPPEYRPNPLGVFVVYPPSRQLSTKVRVFIEWVAQIHARLNPPARTGLPADDFGAVHAQPAPKP